MNRTMQIGLMAAFVCAAFACGSLRAPQKPKEKHRGRNPAQLVSDIFKKRPTPAKHAKEIKRPAKIVVTVFMHGTVGSSMNIFDPGSCLHDSWTGNTFSVRVVRRYRNDPFMEYDQILGAEGLTRLYFTDDEKKTGDCPKGSAYIIPAYDAVAQALDGERADRARMVKRIYATNGWSGLLSNRARKFAAKNLYKALIALREEIEEQYGVTPHFHIVTHSHGGNVLLLLAEAENTYKQHLSIDLGVMLGTPMQRETASCIGSTVFKKLYLFYSYGDSVQCSDYFSTKERRSYARMGRIFDLDKFHREHPDLVRCDVRLFVEHLAKRVSHTNMWLAGRSTPVFDFMDPLPLVVLVPSMVNALRDICPHHHRADLHLYAEDECCWITTTPDPIVKPRGHIPDFPKSAQEELEEREIVTLESHDAEEEIYQVIAAHAETMKREWKCSWDSSRSPLFNGKNGHVLKNLLFYW